VHLIPGDRAVLDPFRHDIHVARYQRDRFVTQLDIKDSLEHEEEVIRLVVLMPDEGTVEFGHHDVVSIELGDGPRREIVRTITFPFRVAMKSCRSSIGWPIGSATWC
jgi:hypothetical protein